uniref:Uncharacterized protein n=1 Tax=Nelumbo nucifera TaxID=4432 RepID=A0A822XNI3_NELNU|nr:TPA_asm: hypothetical protein HUJ06_022726 [Nelumbo nucifera]
MRRRRSIEGSYEMNRTLDVFNESGAALIVSCFVSVVSDNIICLHPGISNPLALIVSCLASVVSNNIVCLHPGISITVHGENPVSAIINSTQIRTNSSPNCCSNTGKSGISR